jgi:sugar phosphate isomerase/epimerase
MYVSIRDDTLLAAGFSSIAEGLSYFGLEGVELAVNREYRVHALLPSEDRPYLYLNRDEEVALLGEQAKRAGCRISAFLMPNNFNAKDIDVELAWAVRTVEAAAKLGVPAVRIDAIMHGERDLPMEEREEIFARGVLHVLNATEGLPVDLGIENHGFQGNDPAFLDGLMAKVGSPRLGMTMDTGNFYWAGHPLEKVYQILEHLAPVTKHTHLKNIRYPEEIRNTQRALGYEYGTYVCPITEGDIDHARVVGYLKAAGYDRDLCIEDESLGKYDEAGRRANLKAAADYLKGLAAA